MITLSKRKNSGKNTSTCKPQLTSLVDVMTILLVFLIKSFSTDGNLVTPSSDMKLPLSSSKTPVRVLNSIQISKEYLLSNEKIITSISSFSATDSMEIPELRIWLDSICTKGPDASSELMIESDKDIPFDIIKKVMYTCSKAGKTDFTILVIREG